MAVCFAWFKLLYRFQFLKKLILRFSQGNSWLSYRRVLLVLLFLLFITPFAGFLSPPLPLVHASFKSLPHDFIPRRGSSGALQPIPLAAPTGLASYGSKGNLTTDAVKGSLTFDSLNLVWMLFLRRTLLTTPL
jgi:hypothetical protein